MKRVLFCFLVLTVGTLGSLHADETIRAVQTRLKTGGFYFGEITGRYDNDTATAVTRYQIRNGLPITGKLDPQTSYALGMTDTKPERPAPRFGEDIWRYLKKSDQEYIKRMIAEDARANRPNEPAATIDTSSTAYRRERLRDYIAAFVLAGLDPEVGAETEFFAERVNYFGKPGVPRETIRRDLQRYNTRWPQRAFSLAGELEISSTHDHLKVTFPLRYDLRNGSRRSSGTVRKTLALEKTGGDDLQIVAVNERKAE
jgi:hypothetical protein